MYNEYNRNYYAENKDKYLAKNQKYRKLLRSLIIDAKSKPCEDCKNSYPHYVMDLDHRPDELKTFELSDAIAKGKSKQKILDEIAKCDVVCANCHRVRTFTREN